MNQLKLDFESIALALTSCHPTLKIYSCAISWQVRAQWILVQLIRKLYNFINWSSGGSLRVSTAATAASATEYLPRETSVWKASASAAPAASPIHIPLQESQPLDLQTTGGRATVRLRG